MYQLLYQYLLTNQQLALPGIGNLFVERNAAEIDFTKNSITAPSYTFSFNNEKATVDKFFFQFISQKLSITEVEAINHFNNFLHKIKEQVLSGSVELPEIGILKSNNSSEIVLEPVVHKNIYNNIDLGSFTKIESDITDIYDSGETKIITNTVEIPKEEKIVLHESEDYWWVYAIILALMGLGALLYYYI